MDDGNLKQSHLMKLLAAVTAIIIILGGSIYYAMEGTDDDDEDGDPQQVNNDIIPERPYVIVDTGQTTYFDNTKVITVSVANDSFHGQDAHYSGAQPSYRDNNGGTVTDMNTGLMWQQDPGEKKTFEDAVAGADDFNLAGYEDWRLPSIKELYSLIDFTGTTRQNADESTPYINTDYFVFNYGDESAGERFIDAQYWSSTEYVGTTMNNDPTVFGVNFADGRIKGYPKQMPPDGEKKLMFTQYVRGNPDYGENQFIDNDDGTVTDNATGLIWLKDDGNLTLNWSEALAHAENFSFAGHDDWRLPNAKELQSIVDYGQAPDATDGAKVGPAIDPVFTITENASHFWTGTTHQDGPPDAPDSYAVYVTFGLAEGWMEDPPDSGNYKLMNVHGAGAQRSDPKSGDPDDYPQGHGPQGDVIGIYNYVRLVRG